jgi:hypothetical protein
MPLSVLLVLIRMLPSFYNARLKFGSNRCSLYQVIKTYRNTYLWQSRYIPGRAVGERTRCLHVDMSSTNAQYVFIRRA